NAAATSAPTRSGARPACTAGCCSRSSIEALESTRAAVAARAADHRREHRRARSWRLSRAFKRVDRGAHPARRRAPRRLAQRARASAARVLLVAVIVVAGLARLAERTDGGLDVVEVAGLGRGVELLGLVHHLGGQILDLWPVLPDLGLGARR